jgi:hypothetical protein
MAYGDGQAKEMAKWAHSRLVNARRRAEEAQRQALADLDETLCSAVTERDC